jgi:plastocyanin
VSRRTAPLAGLIAAALILLPIAPANAVVAAATQGAALTGYATPVVVTAKGGPLMFVNTDSVPHDITADGLYVPKKLARKQPWCVDYSRKTCPLFKSQLVGTAQTAEVEGLDLLKSGKQYPFFCSAHTGMKGTLVVQ